MPEEVKEKKREIIKIFAIYLFSKYGYDGVSIRDIASAADCTIPVIYYYFKNKEKLFEEIILNDFFALTERLNEELDRSGSITDIYYNSVLQRKQLNQLDSSIYKLGLKTWMGFCGDDILKKRMRDWEKSKYENTKKIFKSKIKDKAKLEIFSRVFSRLIVDLMLRIIVLEEDLTDDYIREEIEYLINTI